MIFVRTAPSPLPGSVPPAWFDGIVAAPAERIATAYSPQSQSEPHQRPSPVQRFQHVLTACRSEPACARQKRRYQDLVCPHRHDQADGCGPFQALSQGPCRRTDAVTDAGTALAAARSDSLIHCRAFRCRTSLTNARFTEKQSRMPFAVDFHSFSSSVLNTE